MLGHEKVASGVFLAAMAGWLTEGSLAPFV